MAEELQRIDSNLKPSELKAAFKRSRDIDALLDKERELKEKEVQLLILGSGCSGKTTFLKQLRILYGDGYTEKERKEFKPVIYGNVRKAMIRILEAMEEIGLTFTNEELSTKDLHQELLEHADSEDSENNNFSLADRVPLLTKFWNDSSVQTCFGQRNLFYIDDSAKYFFENLERLSHPDYIPTHEDILHARQQTQGVQERKISVNSYNYRVIDVGGQKSQRKKWIHFFEGVTAVVFFVSLSSYDEFVEEDENSNAMHDSLELFEEISQNAFLEKTEFILFLNKHDLFVEKLKTSNLSACFPDYDGEKFQEKLGLLIDQVGSTMTGGDKINRPKTALQKNISKLTRVKKAQKKKQQQKNKGSKQSNNQRGSASISAKKKRLIMKEIKKQRKEENAMEVVTQHQIHKKPEGKKIKETNAEKMDTS